MSVEPVGDAIGTASGIKIMLSILAKGLEALLVEFMLGAGRYGIDDVVLESFNKFMARSSFADIADRLVTTDAIHARRRSEEAAMSADALTEIGIDPIMTRATAGRLRWVADLGMKDHFEGVAPANYKDAIAAIEMRMKS
jgi:3-hydroxyisobutyrate dehydrogenase-like beta-hydroxyacid dehydrogenase